MKPSGSPSKGARASEDIQHSERVEDARVFTSWGRVSQTRCMASKHSVLGTETSWLCVKGFGVEVGVREKRVRLAYCCGKNKRGERGGPGAKS